MKTTILTLLEAAYDKVFSTTEFTSFYSGSTVGGQNNSLITKVQNKVFIIKDLTPLLNSNRDQQNVLFSQFRSIYDGTGERFFNNGVQLDLRGVRFVCLTGVTYIIRSFMRTDLGERFLITDINTMWDSDGQPVKMEAELDAEGNAYDSIFSTIAGGFNEVEGTKLDQLDDERRMCWGLFNHLLERMEDDVHGLRQLAIRFREDRTIKVEVDALAVWMEHARCPPLSKKDGSTNRPVPAEPHRSIKVLGKMAMCIAIVMQQDGPTDLVRSLLRKTCFDTGMSLSLEVMNYLAIYPYASKRTLASKTSFSDTHIANICSHLTAIGVVEAALGPTKSGGAGHPSLCYKLTDKFRIIADIIGLKERSLVVPQSVASPADTADLQSLFDSLKPVKAF